MSGFWPRGPAVWLVGLGLVGLAIPARGAEDKIRVIGQRERLTGTIVEETPTHVKLKVGTMTKEIPVNEIERINYDGEPQSVANARTNERSGQKLEEVLEWYQKGYEELVAKADEKKEGQESLTLLLRDLKFCEARVTARLAAAAGDAALADKAIDLLTRFQEKHPQSRHHFPLHQLLAEMYQLKGDYAKARQALAVVAEKSFPDWELAANIALARIDVAQKQYDKAVAALDKIIAQTANTEDPKLQVQHQVAVITRARCLVAQGQFDQAVQSLSAAIEKTPPENHQARAEALNALGDCYRAQNKHWEALLEYLRVIVLYPDEREQRAQALYYAAESWEELKQPQYAAQLRQELLVRYPNSPWNKKVRSQG